MPDLWNSSAQRKWRDALDRYEDVIARQGVTNRAERDEWYRNALPKAIPLVQRFPALATVPRVALINAPTPVGVERALWANSGGKAGREG